ncbi:MAG: BREX-1 system adenine-specific DNA-methyltransferase PglX [Gammaproteobacteria bacterium]|nr:MAG: BREX-1 system adenine-specific DNA-methyltransferase PglX [Gammaproteobacteria bacterium]
MNTSHIAKYAPKARTDFIAAMTKQAAKYGITANGTLPLEIKGDVALIGDRPFSASIAKSREALVQQVAQGGFHHAIEQAAYSWFNRLCAIRYMELADYLGHGRRVLSHPEQDNGYQILEDCLDIDLPGLDMSRVRELKLDGTKDEELYRELLLGQCRALHQAMPFLFEPLDDATELLLPENLTKTDSLIKELVNAIPEEDWTNIEVIGWLYQFYISEKKDQVMGKVVASEDIPAATQLFTPNWIVKYMVQNSLGAQWLATYPQSPLKGQMEYYIEPAEQTDEVKAQLAAVTPGKLNPEELTLIDPASGSGHILVEAYELFKAIYLERGYRQRDVPQLILEKNLFGLDIDERAAQLTGFALMMKGRADDRRLFERGVKLNVMALVDGAGFDAEGLAKGVELQDYGLKPGDLTELKRLFEHATTFGSLIQVSEELAKKLPALKQLSEATSLDLFLSDALKRLGPLVQQAELLAAEYDAVVANPPYMASRSFNAALKTWVKRNYRFYDRDLFSAFIVRMMTLTKEHGFSGIMTSFVWMFISSYEELRRLLLAEHSVQSLVQLHYDAFDGAKAHVCSFVVRKRHQASYKASFVRLTDFPGVKNQGPRTLEALQNRSCGWLYEADQDDFSKIPGSPLVYWASGNILDCYQCRPLSDYSTIQEGLKTGDNDRFIRKWYEVSHSGTNLTQSDSANWFAHTKGGAFRRWYGNCEEVLQYWNGGAELLAFDKSSVTGRDNYFRENISWSRITSTQVSFRYTPDGSIPNMAGLALYPAGVSSASLLGCLNSKCCELFLSLTSPTVNFPPGIVGAVPIALSARSEDGVCRAVNTSRADWDAYERSWDFQSLPLLTTAPELTPTLESSYIAWITQNKGTTAEMKRLEEENNRLFIDAYGLADELTPDVPIGQITLTVNPAYRYGGKLTEDEQWTRFRQNTMDELVSYAIGCMMGRYSLDAPGLIYAHSGNEGFDPSRYPTFPADDDGIIPLTDTEWFDDDAAQRLVEFISVAWDKSHLQANLDFLADNLSPKKGESSRDTIRRYLCNKFYKDHMQTYKKRPIHWLFSSGKQKAFQCLVYLHRYNEGTLARMRTEYVISLTSKLSSHVEKLEQDKDASGATAEIKGLQKKIDILHKQQAELSSFDEKLRHYADHRISLDLDDGVKVNYGKFGDLLADVKAITGKNPV